MRLATATVVVLFVTCGDISRAQGPTFEAEVVANADANAITLLILEDCSGYGEQG
jgi:hypothetical protein